MVKELLMKKLFVSALLFVCLTGGAQIPADSVVMTVAGKPISLSEFLFIAKKNNEVNLSDRKSLKSYVELFKNFKLKVADAEALGIDTTKSFHEELQGYKTQLISSYFSDKKGEENVIRSEYDRLGETIELSYILFRLPLKTVSKDTVAIYQQALKAYERISRGEDFASVGQQLAKEDSEHIIYQYMPYLFPMETIKAFENAVYAMPVGMLSKPFRTGLGFHIVKIHSRKPNPGEIRVAHILIPFSKDSVVNGDSLAWAQATAIRKQLTEGADFGELAKKYSSDENSAKRGGELPPVEVGKLIEPFEKVAFALEKPGDLSVPVKTPWGYHIIKLIEKKGIPSFDEKKKLWGPRMAQGDRNFEYYKAFDDRLKKEYGYTFFPEAYAELQKLCDEHFPTDKEFYDKASGLNKTLFSVAGIDYPQNEFAYYIQRCPFSTKTYSGDFMQEIYDLFVREVVTKAEKENFRMKHPEFDLLMQEYRDGILLFEISNQKVWSKPSGEQPKLEKEWLKNLNIKYSVSVNWKVLDKIQK